MFGKNNNYRIESVYFANEKKSVFNTYIVKIPKTDL